MPLPPDVVSKFEGKTMAVIGYEQDQVMVSGPPGANPEKDKSVPIYWAYVRTNPKLLCCVCLTVGCLLTTTSLRTIPADTNMPPSFRIALPYPKLMSRITTMWPGFGASMPPWCS